MLHATDKTIFFFSFKRIYSSFIERINALLGPRKKRIVKICFTIFMTIILPIFFVYYGSSYIYKQGGLFSVISRFMDMRVKNVSLMVYDQEGNIIPQIEWHVSSDDILHALPFEIGSYLLDSDPEEVLKNIQHVSWVDHAKVKFRLPDQVIISITESVPFAIWQKDNIFYLVDEQGHKITTNHLERYDYLPWIVGEGANINASEYIYMIKDFSDIYHFIKVAYRVSNRRWSLATHNNIKINLSEQNPRASLEKLSYLQKKYNILNQDIIEIDLRIPDKVFFRPKQEDALMLFNQYS